MASTIKWNYNHDTLAGVVNYDHKCDTTIWTYKKANQVRAMIPGKPFQPTSAACTIKVSRS